MTEILRETLQNIILLLVSGICTLFVFYIKQKLDKIKADVKYNRFLKYIDQVEQIIVNSVDTINEVYVKDLKNRDFFNPEAQKSAFNQCYNLIKNQLNQEGINAIKMFNDDVDSYLKTKIEMTIKQLKGGD